MPFGHGEGYQMLHGANRHKVSQGILDGNLEWEHPMQEVNNWVKQLQTAYNTETLATEAAEISKFATKEDFRKYFKDKPESMKLSPS